MSHFLTLVLVDGADSDPGKTATTLMNVFCAPDLAVAPTAKCDYFRIGGPYDGEIWGKEQQYNLTPAEYQSRYGVNVVRAEDNIRLVSEIVPGLVPFAVVTPCGVWLDCEEKDEQSWVQEVVTLFLSHQDCWVVAMDCHC